jgi:hypothetical protein
MSTREHVSTDLSVTLEPEDTPVRISIQGSLPTVKINWLPGSLGVFPPKYARVAPRFLYFKY